MSKETVNITTQQNKRKVANDIIFILALLLVVAVLGGFLLLSREEGTVVEVTVDGKLYGRYSLDKDQVVEIKNGDHLNVLVIEDGVAYISEANCPGGDCTKYRPIHYTSGKIVCLPHKVYVSITSSDGNNGGVDIVS